MLVQRLQTFAIVEITSVTFLFSVLFLSLISTFLIPFMVLSLLQHSTKIHLKNAE